MDHHRGGIISTSEWFKIYDPQNQTHISDGTYNPLLNNHLYSAIISKLKGSAADNAVSRRDLNWDGIGLLVVLRATYQIVLTASELLKTEQKFSNRFRAPNQSIEHFVTEL